MRLSYKWYFQRQQFLQTLDLYALPFQYVEGGDNSTDKGYYTSQYIGAELDPFTLDYPEYLDGLYNIDGSQDPIYGY